MLFSTRKTRRDARVRSSRRTSPLRLETLEDRCLLATFWNGGGGDLNWNNPLNWSTGQLPGSTDDVTINVPGNVTIEHANGATAINSLVSYDSIDFSGGSLSLNSSSSVYGQFNNGGTVEVLSGTVELRGGGTHTGDFLIDGGAYLLVGGLFQASSHITGAGDLNLLQATDLGVVNIGGNVTLNTATIEGDFAVAGNMTIPASNAVSFNGTPATVGGSASVYALSGTGVVTIAGLFTWNLSPGNNSAGTGETIARGGMHITGTGIGSLQDRTIENGGVAVFDGGTINARDGAVVRNLPGASFEVRNDVGVVSTSGSPLFDNQGAFLKSTGVDVAPWRGIAFNNSGTVEVQSGSLELGSGTHTGDFLIDGGAYLLVGGLFQASSHITGAGDLNLLQATDLGVVNIGGNVTLNTATIEGDFAVAGNMTIPASNAVSFNGTPATVGGSASVYALSGTGVVTIAGLFTWNLSPGNNSAGTGETIARGGMHITGTGIGSLQDRTIENGGVAVFDGGTINARDGAVVRNLPGASFEVRNDVGVVSTSGSPLFDNQGAFLKSTGVDVASMGIAFNNSGTVEVRSGTLAFGSFTQTSGTTILNGGAIVAPLLNIQGGSLTGSGQIFGPVNAAGQVSPGFSPGVIQLNGNYTQVAGGALVIELAGGTPGNLPNQYDQLDVHGTIALAGALNVSLINGFVPAVNQTFVIVNNDGIDAVSGTFSGVPEGGLVTTGDGSQFKVSYVGGDGNDVTLMSIKRPTTTAVRPSATSPLFGVDTVTFTATVVAVPGFGSPTGSVQFAVDGINVGVPVPLVGGTAGFATSTLALGTRSVTASYSGDATSQAGAGTTTVNVIRPASLSGVGFADFNNDGQVDFGEKGIPSVPITLTGTDDLGHAVSLSQSTDVAGAYVFLNLRPGTYTITEAQQPTGFTPGVATVGTGGGTVSGAQLTVILTAGVDAMNYNYGERPAATGGVHADQTAGIGFWNNKNGQALIKALNGGVGNQLGNWLAATFPHMFGAFAGGDDLAGKNNAAVAAFFQREFVVHGQKLDAQVLATALAVYVTDATLDNTGVGRQYDFTVAGNGVATATFNVGDDGAAFGVANKTKVTVMDLLLAVDSQAVNGILYNGNDAKRDMANDVFSEINEGEDD